MSEPTQMDIGVSATAVDKKTGMTFDELMKLVTKGLKAGVPGDAPVYGVLGWGQQVQSLSARPEKRKP